MGEQRASGYTVAPWLVRRGDGTMVQLSPLLYFVAAALDGERGLGEVAEEVSAATGRTVSAENVAFLVSHKLRPLGIVAPGGDDQASIAPAPSASPLLGLHLRVAVVPQALVHAAARRLAPLFVPGMVVAVLAALVAVDAWVLAGPGLGAGARQTIDQPVNVLLLGALMLVAAAFHELGHASACAYGGARPGPIGVGLYLAWPVFYNDVTDSYRLDRTGRLRTDLGGVYFNGICIVASAGAYAASGYEPLLVFVAVQHLVVLQQFLPFVRLDGYYVVADLVGVPDLYRRMGPVLASLVPGRGVAPEVAELRRGPRVAVAAWVGLSVPALVAAVVWLAVNGPAALVRSWRSLAAQAETLGAAVERAEVVPAAVAVVQLLSLAVPVVGIGFALARALTRGVTALAPRLAARLRPPLARPALPREPVPAEGSSPAPSKLWVPGDPGALSLLAGAVPAPGSPVLLVPSGALVPPCPGLVLVRPLVCPCRRLVGAQTLAGEEWAGLADDPPCLGASAGPAASCRPQCRPSHHRFTEGEVWACWRTGEKRPI